MYFYNRNIVIHIFIYINNKYNGNISIRSIPNFSPSHKP